MVFLENRYDTFGHAYGYDIPALGKEIQFWSFEMRFCGYEIWSRASKMQF